MTKPFLIFPVGRFNFLKRVAMLLCFSIVGYSSARAGIRNDREFNEAAGKWFSAWTLLCEQVFKLDKMEPVTFVFFDDQYVYATSTVTIPQGHLVEGPHLMNLHLQWRKDLHHGKLTLPDKSEAPVQVMAFAKPLSSAQEQAFFVMPLPGYWAKTGLTSRQLGLGNLLTGIFIHEFSHTQQMRNFGRSITALEKLQPSEPEFSDNIIQDLFGKDSVYVKEYAKEVALLYESVDGAFRPQSAQEALRIMAHRHARYFINKERKLNEADGLFLTMEGLGQYAMYRWLLHPEGANISKKTAIEGVRRGKKIWSQEQGFALFLVLEQLAPVEKWGKDLFGEKTISVVTLLRTLLEQHE